jgi:hypothetical protein
LERHVLRVTVGATFVADLEAVRQALSHKLPGAGLVEVLHECLRVTLARVQGRRRGSGKKTSAKAPPPGSRYVPAAVRHEVWTRDGGQCAFVGSTGRRCTVTGRGWSGVVRARGSMPTPRDRHSDRGGSRWWKRTRGGHSGVDRRLSAWLTGARP